MTMATMTPKAKAKRYTRVVHKSIQSLSSRQLETATHYSPIDKPPPFAACDANDDDTSTVVRVLERNETKTNRN
jgi:hypothetical protein